MTLDPEFLARHTQAVQAALIAAAAVFQGAVQERLQGGYIVDSQYSIDPGRSGDTAASVQLDPDGVWDEAGEFVTRVGSSMAHTLFWEMGHFNLFLRQYVRVEHWRDALESCGAEMSAAFEAEYQARMAA